MEEPHSTPGETLEKTKHFPGFYVGQITLRMTRARVLGVLKSWNTYAGLVPGVIDSPFTRTLDSIPILLGDTRGRARLHRDGTGTISIDAVFFPSSEPNSQPVLVVNRATLHLGQEPMGWQQTQGLGSFLNRDGFLQVYVGDTLVYDLNSQNPSQAPAL